MALEGLTDAPDATIDAGLGHAGITFEATGRKNMSRAVFALLLMVLPFDVSAWSYASRADEMGRGTIKRAWVQSTNTLELDFPYRGPQRATLHLRIHSQYGKDVMLSIERGQFLCKIDRCTVLVRFDKAKPERYEAAQPSDLGASLVELCLDEHRTAAVPASR